jgi:hypothetical protein
MEKPDLSPVSSRAGKASWVLQRAFGCCRRFFGSSGRLLRRGLRRLCRGVRRQHLADQILALRLRHVARHRVAGMRLAARGFGQLRNVGLLQRGEEGRDAEVAIELHDSVEELLRQGVVPFAFLAQLGAHRQHCQPLGDGRQRILQHQRQHDGIGQAVGGVVPAAELVRDGMHVTDIRARECQPGIGGRQGHFLARHEIGAVGIGHPQVVENQADRRQGHVIGVGIGPFADEGFDGVRQGIDAGRRGDRRRQPGHQAGIERRHLRHQARIDDHQLGMPLGIGDHSGHGNLGPGAGRGGHGIDLDRGLQALEIACQFAQRLAGIGYCGCYRLRGIHRGAAADRDDGIAAIGAKELDAVLDQGYRRIRSDGIEHHVLGAACRQSLGQILEQAQLGDHAVGNDEDLAVTEAGNGLSQSCAGTRPDQDRRLRYGQEAHGQAGTFHGGTECRGAK